MRELDVLLTAADPDALADKSIALQKVFREASYVFKINYQKGRFAQFVVEANSCALHFENALRKLDFNVHVSGDERQTTTMEECHDCQSNLLA